MKKIATYYGFKSNPVKRCFDVDSCSKSMKLIRNLFLDKGLFMGFNWNGNIAFNRLLLTSEFLRMFGHISTINVLPVHPFS